MLIVVAIIGLLAAIAVPNLLNSIQRGRQSRTVGDVRTISNALAMYQTDFMNYPIASSWVSFGTIRNHLLIYKGNLNDQDGWKKAEDVADLARLFTVMPPPPPPPPGA